MSADAQDQAAGLRGGTIKLDIYQEVSNVSATLVSGARTHHNKRSIDTKVLVDDGHTIILGGLIEDNKNETEQSVPLLGRLPLIGGLFATPQKPQRTNLMVFLRPVIIHGPQESYSVTRSLSVSARPHPDIGAGCAGPVCPHPANTGRAAEIQEAQQ